MPHRSDEVAGSANSTRHDVQNDVVHGDAARQSSPRWELVPGRPGIYGADQRRFLNGHEVDEFPALKHEQHAPENGLRASCLSAVLRGAGSDSVMRWGSGHHSIHSSRPLGSMTPVASLPSVSHQIHFSVRLYQHFFDHVYLL